MEIFIRLLINSCFFRKMAATENGVFTNHTEEVQVNGHNLEEKPPTKKIHEEKPYNEKLFQHETSQVNGYPEQVLKLKDFQK